VENGHSQNQNTDEASCAPLQSQAERAGLSLWFALLYPFEVSIQKLAQGCPVPPGPQSQPEKECPRRQDNHANEVSVEQDNRGEDSGGPGSQKSNYGAASQEESPQPSIHPSHWIHDSLHTAEP